MLKEADVRRWVLVEGKDYVVCALHKTTRTYGHLAKWLAPGTVEAVRCYLGLPRRQRKASSSAADAATTAPTAATTAGAAAVRRSVGRSDGPSVGRSVDRSVGRSV